MYTEPCTEVFSAFFSPNSGAFCFVNFPQCIGKDSSSVIYMCAFISVPSEYCAGGKIYFHLSVVVVFFLFPFPQSFLNVYIMGR